MALLEAGVSNLQDRGGQIAVSDMIHVANVALYVMKSWTNDKRKYSPPHVGYVDILLSKDSVELIFGCHFVGFVVDK